MVPHISSGQFTGLDRGKNRIRNYFIANSCMPLKKANKYTYALYIIR